MSLICNRASAGGKIKRYLFLLLLFISYFSTEIRLTRASILQDSLYINNGVVDTVIADSISADTVLLKGRVLSKLVALPQQTVMDTLSAVGLFPAVSLQQYLKGQAPGLYVTEPSGEPGSTQPFFIRGLSLPLIHARDLAQTQPLVVLDGVQLIAEHPFAYDIQEYDFDRIGTATNLLANIDLNNIENVEILKEANGISRYGPRGANGVIVLTSKQPASKREVSFNSYMGLVQRPTVTTINGAYENAFRRQFYDRYTSNGKYYNDDIYPLYLSDSLNTSYYGPSDWTDSYYQNQFIYSLNAGISGGTDRASFRFSLGNLQNKGVADGTGFDRYSAMFSLNMKPLPWLMFTAMFNGNRLERARNRNFRERFAQMNYIPDLSAPPAPNNQVYSRYLSQFDNSYDENNSNLVQGYAGLAFDFGKLKLLSRFSVDYNEGHRDLFYPRTLLEESSFVSNYFGYNQRLQFDNSAVYDLELNDFQKMDFEVGQMMQWDTHKYNYAYGYKGVNDFIKLNLLDSDPRSDNPNYLIPTAFPRELVFKYLDRTRHNLMGYYARTTLSSDERYRVSRMLRYDGSSNAQPTNQWLFAPVLAAEWNLKKTLMSESSDLLNEFSLRATAGRTGRLNLFDNLSQGPQYTAQIGFTGNINAAGYNGFAGLLRPYTAGWVGYDLPWAYSDQLNVGTGIGLWNNRLEIQLDAYTRMDKNMALSIPAYAEYGYQSALKTGMEVQNYGLDVTIQGVPIQSQGSFRWVSTLNLNFNENRLQALPDGMDNLAIGNRYLQVGRRIDQLWLFQNEGIYQSVNDIPVVDGVPLRFNGIDFQPGDPIWSDLNADNRIDQNDKVLKGNLFPKVAGGFSNAFHYGNWSLNTLLYFNLGRHLINQEMANRFDFINREGTSDMSAVKEITFWEKRGDYDRYPLYNPWSPVVAYRSDQDLFLENASFMKLRTLSLGYDMTAFFARKAIPIKRFYVYVSGHNLFTITSYSGRDPELVDFTGFDTGYGLPIPRTYTLGINMTL